MAWIRSGTPATLGDVVDVGRCLLAGLGDDGQEFGVNLFDPGLDIGVGCGRGAFEQVGLARQRGGLNAIGADPELGQRTFEAGQHAEHADRTRDGRRFGKDMVGRARDPIAAGTPELAPPNDPRALAPPLRPPPTLPPPTLAKEKGGGQA